MLIFLSIILTGLFTGACYTLQHVPGGEMHLEKRDRIESVTLDNEVAENIWIGMQRNGIDGAYISRDTLFIKVNRGELASPVIKEFSIPLTEINFAEIRRHNKEASSAAWILGGALYIAAGILVALGIIWFLNALLLF